MQVEIFREWRRWTGPDIAQQLVEVEPDSDRGNNNSSVNASPVVRDCLVSHEWTAERDGYSHGGGRSLPVTSPVFHTNGNDTQSHHL